MLQAELIAAQTPPRTIARAVMADAGKAGAVGAGGGRGGISEARRSIPSERMEGTVCEVCEVNSNNYFQHDAKPVRKPKVAASRKEARDCRRLVGRR